MSTKCSAVILSSSFHQLFLRSQLPAAEISFSLFNRLKLYTLYLTHVYSTEWHQTKLTLPTWWHHSMLHQSHNFPLSTGTLNIALHFSFSNSSYLLCSVFFIYSYQFKQHQKYVNENWEKFHSPIFLLVTYLNVIIDEWMDLKKCLVQQTDRSNKRNINAVHWPT